MDIKDFLNTVSSQIKYKPVRKNIEEELKSHIEEAKEEYKSKGFSESEAEEKSIKSMGNPEEIGKKLNKIHKPKFDWILVLLVLILLGFGIFIAILQNDTSYSQNMTSKTITYTIIGSILCAGVYFIDYRKLKKYSTLIYIIATLIMFMPYIGLRSQINGVIYASLFGNNFLTATVALPLYLIAFIGWITNYKKENTIKIQIENSKIEINKDIIKIVILSIISIILVYLIPSFSNAIVLTLSYLIVATIKILKDSNHKIKNLIKLFCPFCLMFLIIMSYILTVTPYRMDRITTSLNPELDPTGNGYQGMLQKEILQNAKMFGEADTYVMNSDEILISKDSIFTFIYLVGKKGIVVAGILVLAIILLSLKMILNAKNIKDTYGKFLIIGVGTLYIIQSVISVLMNVNLAVIINVSLPLVSYGGVYFIINMLCIGLVLSVYRRKDIIEYEEMSE